MVDGYGRKIEYLRLSITDRCNLNCLYCTPENCVMHKDTLRADELINTVKAAVSLGINKVRITGGEPLMRKDCAYIAAKIKDIDGIDGVYLTTNGVLLDRYANDLKKAGIDGVNISLDTADRDEYKSITGHDMLHKVISGIDALCELKIPIKLNSVATSHTSQKTVYKLLEYPKNRDIDLRFIELMPIGNGSSLEFLSNDTVLSRIDEVYPLTKSECVFGSPAVYYTSPLLLGKIGFINAISHKFCSSCNRLRVTSDGILKPCLCYESDIDIKGITGDIDKLKEAFVYAVSQKPLMHCFDDVTQITEKHTMNTIGG